MFSLWMFLLNWIILMVILQDSHTLVLISLHSCWNSPSLNLFVFVIHMRQQVKHEMNLYWLQKYQGGIINLDWWTTGLDSKN